MKRFRFRLEKILRYKIQVEERKKQILSERNNELRIEKTHLEGLNNRNASYRDRYSSLFRGKLNIPGLGFSYRYLEKLYRDIINQKDKVRKSEEKSDQARKQLRVAMRDRKKYEKLKQRRRREYEYEAGREEQKELDEIASRPAVKISSMDIAP
ncbi:MAG: flagellar export protein FliJ [Candidatus Zixiibacteriota bacterium]|nr:MAG: flagellar export protein FliJ [candidate division Zixibacteria bacterium]